VELDVQRCASGEVVVIHDETLDRTTGKAGVVTATRWSEIRALDAGSWKAARFSGTRVPLLSEVLEAFPAFVNIELKTEATDDRGLTLAVVRDIRRGRAENRVLLSSFNPLCLLRARLLAPRIPRALLFESEQRWPLRSALAAPLLAVKALHPEHTLATPARVAGWKRRGYSIAAWTVDDPELAVALWKSGASGVITNRPDVLRARFG
jgi:glycerophosphoryl diester phosphodiesterase